MSTTPPTTRKHANFARRSRFPVAAARPAALAQRSPCLDSTPATHPRSQALRTGLVRFFDIAAAATALAVLSPLTLLIAFLIKATSPGPIFYRQLRVGHNRRRGCRRACAESGGPHDRRRGERREQRSHGCLFDILKFRTMVVNAEEYGPQWSSKDDPRITAIGKFLRFTRLDETPQFVNVLRGQMSLIGPRPERPYFVEQFAECIPDYTERLRVRPGITGLAQVTLDYDSSIDDVKKKLEQDLKYVRSRSVWQDLKILVRTAVVVATGKGAC